MIDQIAFGCRTKEQFDIMANTASAVDEVTFSGYFYGLGGDTQFTNKVGHLAFDYLEGIEREYLYYPKMMDTFHDLIPHKQNLFLSHLGSHVESIDLVLGELGVKDVVMDVTTTKHTNPKVGDRRYRYVILDWRRAHGYFYKLIQRL